MIKEHKEQNKKPFSGSTALFTANFKLYETILAVLRRKRNLLGLQISRILGINAASVAMFLGRRRNMGILALRKIRRHSTVPPHTSSHTS